MKKKTILVAAIAVMLVAALVVGGTLAYFTDTKSADNVLPWATSRSRSMRRT